MITVISTVIGVVLTGIVTFFVTHRLERGRERRLRKAAEEERQKAFFRQLASHLESSWDAFVNQCKARDRLYDLLEKNRGELPPFEYEELFRRCYPSLDDEEKLLFSLIRGITETSLYKLATSELQLLGDHPELLDELPPVPPEEWDEYPKYYDGKPSLKALREHLELWESKHRARIVRQDTCLIYVGPEEGKPFPQGIDTQIAKYLDALTKRQTG